nr:TetR family transcriptional regulator [Streptomyces sp. SID13031]
MIISAASLLRDRGVAGTSVAKVLDHSKTPRGSVGHHFPGGRTELLTEALRWAATRVTVALEAAYERGDSPAQVFAMMCNVYRRQLDDSGFTAGCPVGAAAQEAFNDAELGPVVAEILASWVGSFAGVFIKAGRKADEADELATLCISALEGAIMVARVQRSSRSLKAVEERLSPLL